MARLRKGQTRKLTKRERELLEPDLRAFFAARAQFAESVGRLDRIIQALESAPDVKFDPDTLELSRPPATTKGKGPRRKK